MSYRIVDEDAEDEGGLGPNVVEAEDGRAVPVMAKSYYQGFMASVCAVRPLAKEPFKELVGARWA